MHTSHYYQLIEVSTKISVKLLLTQGTLVLGAVATVFFSTNNSICRLVVHVLAYFSFLKLLAIFEQCKMKIINYGWVNTQVLSQSCKHNSYSISEHCRSNSSHSNNA